MKNSYFWTFLIPKRKLYKAKACFLKRMDEQEFVEERPNKVKRFINEIIRVIRITKKPNKAEYISLVKITGLGIAIIGLIGFAITLIKQLLF